MPRHSEFTRERHLVRAPHALSMPTPNLHPPDAAPDADLDAAHNAALDAAHDAALDAAHNAVPDGRPSTIEPIGGGVGPRPCMHGASDARMGGALSIHLGQPDLGGRDATLEQLALVARLTTNLVVITDLERRIVWANEAFERTSGYSLEEVRGRVPGDFLQGPRTDRATIARMRASLARHEACRVEILNVARDGREYWLDVEIQPVRGADGRPTGFIAIETDITDAVLAREALVEAERKRRLVVEGAEAGTWDWHIPSGAVTFNEQWCRMLGYEPGEIEPHVRSWERVAVPDDLAVARRMLAEHFEGRSERYRLEHRLRAKDGSIVWVLDAGRVYERDHLGRPVRMAGIHLDITERREAEELRRLVVAGAASGIWDWRVERDLIEVSPRLAAMVGEPEALPAAPLARWIARVHPDDQAIVTRALEAHLRRREPYSVEVRVRLASGGYRWFHISGQAVWNEEGAPVRVAGSLDDIHDRRILERSRARLAAIVEHSPDAVVGVDLDGRVATMNKAAWTLYGESFAIGCDERQVVPAPDAAREHEATARVVASRAAETMESRRRHADGREVPVSLAISPVFGEDGAVTGVSKVARDLSALRDKRELETLNARLSELNALLESQNRRLAEMTERAHRFVDEVSHDFRTPLTVIREYAALVADGVGGEVTPVQESWLRTVEDAANDLSHMVEDFLDSSRLRAGRLRVDRRPVRPEAIVGGVLDMLSVKARANGIRLHSRFESAGGTPLPDAFADPDKARRILANLLTNAIKFSPEDGEVRVIVARHPDGDLEFRVEDDGPGLAADEVAHLFERFRQGPAAVAASAKGFGLGLSIARQLVWLNLGSIRAESEAGHGARFSFTLPANDPALVVRRAFERFAEREEPVRTLALLEVVPPAPRARDPLCGSEAASAVNGRETADAWRMRLAEGSDAVDVLLPSRRGFLLFGPTEDAAAWRACLAGRLASSGASSGTSSGASSGASSGTSSEASAPASVELVGAWPLPEGAEAARAAILARAAGGAA
ncbi:MAG: hypothetical protein RI967_2093 [Planctomycetota bacterium]